MEEIKSTLELALEKTKHLSFTDEERTSQKRTALQARVRGLIQRYSDGVIRKEVLRERIAACEDESRLNCRHFIVAALAEKITLAEDPSPQLDILEWIAGIPGESLRHLWREYHDRRAALSRRCTITRLAHFATFRGIAGTAIVPNLDADEDWAAGANCLAGEFENRVRQEVERLSSLSSEQPELA